jgi:hypothetical protein
MTNDATAPRRPRRRWWIALVAIALLALVAGTLGFLAQPQRATRLIMAQAGGALGLRIEASGGEYRLSPMPSLVVRDVVAREPGAAQPLLRADRIALSLPWSTVRSRGRDLTIERVELDKPVIDVAALQHWLQRRPPGETRIPVLTDGLQVENGTLVGSGWTIGALDVSLPALAPAQRVRAHASGRYRSDGLQVPFSLAIALSTPAADAAIGVAGTVSVQRPDWRLPARIVLSGRLRSDGLRLERTKLAASARYDAGATHAPFAMGVGGTLHLERGMRLQPAAIAIRGSGLVPTFDAAGTITLDDALDVAIAGAIASWPAAWPELPAPLGGSQSPLPFRLRYTGAPDLSAITELAVQRDDARFDGRFRLAAISDWIGAGNASPLPPLDGRIRAPRLDIAGAQLQGVDITFDDPQVPGRPTDADEVR